MITILTTKLVYHLHTGHSWHHVLHIESQESCRQFQHLRLCILLQQSNLVFQLHTFTSNNQSRNFFSRESPESGMPYLIDLSAPVLTTEHKIKIHFDPDSTCYSAFYVFVRNVTMPLFLTIVHQFCTLTILILLILFIYY